MAKAKKLPSGNWRVQLFVGKDPAGKPKYKSFTAPTRKEAEYLAAQYALDLAEQKSAPRPLKDEEKPPLTFKQAAEDWIEARRNILSPATTRMYDSMMRCAYTPILHENIYELTLQQFQQTVNWYAGTHSPKSVRNAYGLMRTVVAAYRRDFAYKYFEQINLPTPEDHDVAVPEDDHVTPMIHHLKAIKGKNDMLFVVLMAATLGLRRSEICALTQDDFVDGTVRITKALVLSYDNKTYVIKGTKSRAGRRTLNVNPGVFQTVKSLGSDPRTGRIVSLTPARVTFHYTKLAKEFGVPGTLHDLRHYYASILAALNVPTKSAMKRLGHSTPQVTEQVYQHPMSNFESQFDRQIDAHITQLLS